VVCRLRDGRYCILSEALAPELDNTAIDANLELRLQPLCEREYTHLITGRCWVYSCVNEKLSYIVVGSLRRTCILRWLSKMWWRISSGNWSTMRHPRSFSHRRQPNIRIQLRTRKLTQVFTFVRWYSEYHYVRTIFSSGDRPGLSSIKMALKKQRYSIQISSHHISWKKHRRDRSSYELMKEKDIEDFGIGFHLFSMD